MRPEIQVDVIASCPCIFFSFYLVCFEEKSKLLVLSVSPRSYFVIAELERSITSVLHMYLNLIRINFGGKYSWWFYVIVWFLFLLHWFQYCCLLCMLCSSSRVLETGLIVLLQENWLIRENYFWSVFVLLIALMKKSCTLLTNCITSTVGPGAIYYQSQGSGPCLLRIVLSTSFLCAGCSFLRG